MRVSIVVPIYNVEKYIKNCLESIKAQTFTDFELLLIDDGSTDESGKIADEYALTDNRAIVYHKTNGGLSDARNYGIDRARGEYICFIDSDDWIESTYLEELVKLADANKAEIAICAYKRNTGEESIEQPQKNEENVESGTEALGNIWSSRYGEYVVAWNKLYNRKLFEENRYTVGMIHEDEAICANLYLGAERVVRTNRVLYNYRINNNTSIMTSNYSLKRLDIIKAIEIRMDILRRNGLKSYYEKDSFKYMYKILLNIIEVRKLSGDNSKVIKELKEKYWNKYRESKEFDWSIKRRIGMFLFGFFPKAYLFRYKKGN